MTSEIDVGGMAAQVDPSHQYPATFCCHVKMVAEGQPGKMASDAEVCMKQRYLTEYLHEEK